MRNILLLLLLFIPHLSFSQQTLFGSIIDKTTKEPLVGVTIIIKGTSIGTISEWDGTFVINTELESLDLEFSYVSYKKLTIDSIPLVGELTTLPDIEMEEYVLLTDDVVITADRIVKNEIGLIDLKMKSINQIDENNWGQ
jgi:hypothetical protein